MLQKIITRVSWMLLWLNMSDDTSASSLCNSDQVLMSADAGEVIKQRRTCRRRDRRGPGEARRPRCPRGARHTAGPSSTPDSGRRRPWFSPPLCNLSPCCCSTPSPVLQTPPPPNRHKPIWRATHRSPPFALESSWNKPFPKYLSICAHDKTCDG